MDKLYKGFAMLDTVSMFARNSLREVKMGLLELPFISYPVSQTVALC